MEVHVENKMNSGWVEGIVYGDPEIEETYFFQAKVYDEGSKYGINNGRVSKLVICNGYFWDAEEWIYNYDRGLDFNNASIELTDALIEALERL